jgi:hypothetical protein
MRVFQESFRKYYISEVYYHDIEYIKAHPNSRHIIAYFKECGVPYPLDGEPLFVPPEVNIYIDTLYDGIGRYFWNFLFYDDIPPVTIMKWMYEFNQNDVSPLYEIYRGNVLSTAMMIKILWRESDDAVEFVRDFPNNMKTPRCKDAPIFLEFANLFVRYIAHFEHNCDVECVTSRGKSFKAIVKDWKTFVKEEGSEAVYARMYGIKDKNKLYTKTKLGLRIKDFHLFLWTILCKGKRAYYVGIQLKFTPK